MGAVRDDDVEAFWVDGVVCLRQVLPPAWVARMAEAVARASLVDLSAMAGREGGARFRAGTDHWRDDDDFRAFACDSPLPGLAAELLRSERVWLYEDSVLVKEPGSVEATKFHSDEGYFHVSGEQVCTFWCPLDPVTLATGALQYVSGSHRWDRHFRPNLFVTEDTLPGTEGEVVPAVVPDLSFEMQPGDVTVHHYRTLHGAPGNSSLSQTRRAVSVRYCGDDARYHLKPGAPRKPHQEHVNDGDALGGPDAPLVFGSR
jgi:ectoine hydroxylase-related dioxygenase (phytanoyl-CoA dioxygenase family)